MTSCEELRENSEMISLWSQFLRSYGRAEAATDQRR